MGEEKPRPAKVPWQGWALLGAGVALVLGASLFAQRAGLGRNLVLDFRGMRAIGSAEPMADGAYSLRYEHPSGVIYRRHYSGRLSGEPSPEEAFDIAIVFDPDDPRHFQPAGLSYLPGVAALTAFIVGMVCVLKAHARIRAHYLKKGGRSESKSEKRRKKRRKLDPARQRRKILRLLLSIIAALFLLTLLYGCPQLNIPSIWDSSP